MTYSNTEIEIIINEHNIDWFKIYYSDGFNFIYPSGNVELCNYWNCLIGYYYYSQKEWNKYNNQVFKTFPDEYGNVNTGNKLSRNILGDKLVFQFPDEETAFYFKLKFC